jgi:hypothetical protein
MTQFKLPDKATIEKEYRGRRLHVGIKEAVQATAKHFGMDPKDVCIALGLDPGRWA